MKTRFQLLVVTMGLLTMAAAASAAKGGGTCGNIPPRDGTGRQVRQHAVVHVSPMGWVQQALRHGIPVQFGALGWGPGDGTGLGGDGPKDGTGYGPGGFGDGTGICDGSGRNAVLSGPKR